MNKKYKLKLGEIELITLYIQLKRKNNKPHNYNLESQIENIFEKNKEFDPWKHIIDEIKKGEI